jgi:hypothetical protein
VTFLPNLALASLAGVANILVTMPLDVVVTRMQVAPMGRQRPSFKEMVRTIWEEGGSQGKGKGKGSGHEALFWRLARFWHGLVPALILTSNPAINYATFDALKALAPVAPGKKRHGPKEMFVIGMLSKFVATVITYPLIRTKVMMMSDTKRLRALVKPQEKQEAAAEAEAAATQAEAQAEAEVGGFRDGNDEEDEEEGAMGAVAAAGGAGAASSSSSSSPATSSASPPSSLGGGGGGSGGGSGGLTPSGPSFASTSTHSVLSPSLQLMAEERQGLLEIMRQLVREGGVRELYVGLDGQIINTALKNAVLMNTKDRISRVTAFLLRRLFVGGPSV